MGRLERRPFNLYNYDRKDIWTPGTGKTTELLNIVDQLIASGVSTKRIGFTTFTKAGANEALDRACDKFAKDAGDFPFFKTIHALAYNNTPRKTVLGYSHMKEISKDLSIPLTYSTNTADGSISSSYRGDHIRNIYQLSRVKCTSIEEEFQVYDTPMDITVEEIQYFVDYYVSYKEHNNLQDFTDMLEIFIHLDKSLPIDYLIIDEAQDTKPLEWKMLDIMMQSCKKTYVAGDDDQCIHAWAGSDPQAFIRLPGESRVLSQSFRVPSEVHGIAHNVIHRVAHRQEKEYLPKVETGSVSYITNLHDLDITEGSWFMLARNRRMILDFELFCRERGLPYHSPLNKTDRIAQLSTVVDKWEHLINGGLLLGKDVKLIYKHLKTRDKVVYGMKELVEAQLDDDDMFQLDDLVEQIWLIVKVSVARDVY